MMVESSPQMESLKRLAADLGQPTVKLKKIQEGHTQEIKELIGVLQDVNRQVTNPHFWQDKKLGPKEMDVSLQEALQETRLFIEHKAMQKNVNQAIISLFAALTDEMNALDKNLKNLKEDYKIGRKVEKTSESKQT